MSDFSDKKSFILCIFITLIILIIIPSFRALNGDPVFAGIEPYEVSYFSRNIHENGFFEKDPLINRPYHLDPTHIILSFISSFGDYAILGAFFLLGILAVVIIFNLLLKIQIEGIERMILTLLIVISPPFIYLFSVPNTYAFPFVLAFFGIYLFAEMSNIWGTLFIFSMLAFFHPVHLLTGLGFLISYSFLTRKNTKALLYISIASISLMFILHSGFYLNYGFPELADASLMNRASNIVSDFGGLTGYGIFHLLLAVIGIYSAWPHKKTIVPVYIFFILFFSSIYFSKIGLYLNIAVCYFAFYGLFNVLNRRWELNSVKKLTFLLILCGLIFSSISYINRMVLENPDSEIQQALIFLSEEPRGTVFSHPKNGDWIKQMSHKHVFLDSGYSYTADIQKRLNVTNELFYSRNLQRTMNFLDEYDISYIFIDKEMKQGLVWSSEQQGMLFLFRNSKIFKNTYSSENTEIWKVIR